MRDEQEVRREIQTLRNEYRAFHRWMLQGPRHLQSIKDRVEEIEKELQQIIDVEKQRYGLPVGCPYAELEAARKANK